MDVHQAIPLTSLSLYPATPDQLIAARKDQYEQWGRHGGHSLEDHLAMERNSDQLEAAKDGKLQTWVLAPRNDKGTINFMCSCETYRRQAIVVRKASDGSVETEEVTAYGIASVLTPPQNRGNGYARHMMRLLHWIIAPPSSLPQESQFPIDLWGQPPERHPELGMGNAAFSVLYSDVGFDFYSVCGPIPDTPGWVAQGNHTVVLDLNGRTDLEQPPPIKLGQWAHMDIGSLSDGKLWEVDEETIRGGAKEKLNNGEIGYSFLPRNGVENHQRLRTASLIPSWMKARPLQIWGLRHGDRKDTFITWTLERLRDQSFKVTILRQAIKDRSLFEDMLPILLHKLYIHGVQKLEFWNLDDDLIPVITQQPGGVAFDREEHLASAKWYGSGNSARWLFNERFAWC